MNQRKQTVLRVEYDLFKRKLRTKIAIFKMWKDDAEAIEYLKYLFNPKKS